MKKSFEFYIKCIPAVHKLVGERYFKLDEEALERSVELPVPESKIIDLRKRIDKTAKEMGGIEGKPMSRLIEEMHEEEDKL